MKKVVVTGGAGYIGSHAVVALGQAGYQPVVVDNYCASERSVPSRLARLIGRDVVAYELDCRDRAALREVFREQGEVCGVLHFAAHKSVSASVSDPREYYDNNVGALLGLLGAADDEGVRELVFSSSCTVYGQPTELPVTESAPLGTAVSPYGSTKQMCERIIEDVVRGGAALRCVSLRYFNPIGAHPSGEIGELPLGPPQTLVPHLTRVALGKRPAVTVFGDDYPTRDGTCIRDYLHVVDLAEAHVAALDWLARRGDASRLCETFNVGRGGGVSVLEAVRAFERANDVRLPVRIGPRRPGDAVEVYADASKASELLGWRASRSLVAAMRDAYRWEKNLWAGRGGSFTAGPMGGVSG